MQLNWLFVDSQFIRNKANYILSYVEPYNMYYYYNTLTKTEYFIYISKPMNQIWRINMLNNEIMDTVDICNIKANEDCVTIFHAKKQEIFLLGGLALESHFLCNSSKTSTHCDFTTFTSFSFISKKWKTYSNVQQQIQAFHCILPELILIPQYSNEHNTAILIKWESELWLFHSKNDTIKLISKFFFSPIIPSSKENVQLNYACIGEYLYTHSYINNCLRLRHLNNSKSLQKLHLIDIPHVLTLHKRRYCLFSLYGRFLIFVLFNGDIFIKDIQKYKGKWYQSPIKASQLTDLVHCDDLRSLFYLDSDNFLHHIGITWSYYQNQKSFHYKIQTKHLFHNEIIVFYEKQRKLYCFGYVHQNYISTITNLEIPVVLIQMIMHYCPLF